MPRTLPSGNSFSLHSRRKWLWLIVVITLLFNPFFGISSASFGTIVNHLPSFRATVASSELLKFTPLQKVDEQFAVELALLCQVDLAANLQDDSAPLAGVRRCFITAPFSCEHDLVSPSPGSLILLF